MEKTLYMCWFVNYRTVYIIYFDIVISIPVDEKSFEEQNRQTLELLVNVPEMHCHMDKFMFKQSTVAIMSLWSRLLNWNWKELVSDRNIEE